MPPLLAAQFLFGDSDRLLVAVNFGVKALQRLPHLLHPLQQQLPLLNEDLFAGLGGILPLLKQGNLLDQSLHLDTGSPHTLGKLHPGAVLHGIIPDAALAAVNGGNQADALVIPQGIG